MTPMKNLYFLFTLVISPLFSSGNVHEHPEKENAKQPVYSDTAFIQKYSVKYFYGEAETGLLNVCSDRNGNVKILSRQGLLLPRAGQFLFPGTLVPDRTYRPMTDKRISSMIIYKNQFVYLDDQAVLSNAWAGSLYCKHKMPDARLIAAGPDFTFLISNGRELALVKDSGTLWHKKFHDQKITHLTYDSQDDRYFILTPSALHLLRGDSEQLKKIFAGNDLTAMTLSRVNKKIIIGTRNGYQVLDAVTLQPDGPPRVKLPAVNITAVREIHGQLWFGTDKGAFMLRKDGKFDYYYGKRWIPDNRIQDIAPGPHRAVLILTGSGLGMIRFENMNLLDKAAFFQNQVRQRHIRNGFNATLGEMKDGDVTTGVLKDSDNDGLWTAMYLGGEIFRYAVTKSPDALQNCRESMDAMERLYTINPVPGFPSRSFERSGYIPQLADPHRWQQASDPEWVWKATTSSDEAIGHMFAFGTMAEIIDDEGLKNRAIHLMDILMQHIIDHNLYLVDYDGKPTRWGRWNPEYVNRMPVSVGDRKLNSSNIISMLQTAYYFTKKEVYRDKAFELMNEYGYFENLMRPMSSIGRAPDHSDQHSRMLSGSWNHSDDEMYFLGYWGLYRYALNDTLKSKFKEAIIDHWEAERPEKEALWDLMTAVTGTENFDLEAAAWYLRRYPLDLITWEVKNSQRKDIEKLTPNFRRQSIRDVLPPDELKISRHNANRFALDGGNSGTSEYSAGDIWLLPYWLGRFLGVISQPQGK